MKILAVLEKYVKKIVSATAAAVVAVTCASFPTDSSDALTVPDYPALADEIVVLVNEARIEAGLNPLYVVPVLNDAAEIRVLESVEYFSHYRPDSTLFNTVLDEYQISYSAAAENIAAGLSTPEETFEQWKNSPNHWKSIMNEAYTHIGVGVCYEDDSEYGWYWEQLFIATDQELEGQYLPEKYAVVPVSYGDVDGDGILSVFDLQLLIKRLNKQIVLNDLQMESTDCMKDGALTIADAVVLKKYLVNVYDTLPVYP